MTVHSQLSKVPEQLIMQILFMKGHKISFTKLLMQYTPSTTTYSHHFHVVLPSYHLVYMLI